MAAISKTPSGSYRGVFTSQPIDSVVDAVNNMQGNGTAGPVTASTLSATTSQTFGGTLKITPQIVTAAGLTQGNATAITSQLAIVTLAATASLHGVKLPSASTGLEVMVGNSATHSCKVWPSTGDKIGAASSNSADSTLLAPNKANRYVAVNTTLWIVQRGS